MKEKAKEKAQLNLCLMGVADYNPGLRTQGKTDISKEWPLMGNKCIEFVGTPLEWCPNNT